MSARTERAPSLFLIKKLNYKDLENVKNFAYCSPIKPLDTYRTDQVQNLVNRLNALWWKIAYLA